MIKNYDEYFQWLRQSRKGTFQKFVGCRLSCDCGWSRGGNNFPTAFRDLLVKGQCPNCGGDIEASEFRLLSGEQVQEPGGEILSTEGPMQRGLFG